MHRVFLIILLSPILLLADTFYCGSGETYTTVGAGIAAMSGGDTLIIRDGTYTGTSNDVAGVPSGSSGDWTCIMAETDWGVTIDLNQATGSTGIDINADSYITIRGIHFTDTDYTVCSVQSSNHIKILKCSFSETSSGNHYGCGIRLSTYVLVEDCFAFGQMRYAFGVSGSSYSNNYVIFRRCVARLDYFNQPSGEEPHGGFITYQEREVYFQNCISVDGLEARNYGEGSYTTHFFSPNGGDNNHWLSSIIISSQGSLIFYEGNTTGMEVDNCLFLGNDKASWASDWMGANGAATDHGDVTNCSFFYNDNQDGIDAATQGSLNIQRCTFYGDTITNYLLSDVISDSIAAFGFTGTLYNTYANSNGTNRFTDAAYNPLSNYDYPAFPTSGSTLDNANIGCNIYYRLGASGTLYGETGWNTLQDTCLWPFPNESTIRTTMRAYTTHDVDGTRGFCAEGQTLTEYILEYFGNEWEGVVTEYDSDAEYINSGQWTFVQDFQYNGNDAVGTYQAGIKTFDITDLDNIVEKDYYYTGEQCYGVDILNDTAFVATDSFLYKFNISNLSSISVIDSEAITGGRDVVVRNDSLWHITASTLSRRSAISLDTVATVSIISGGNSLTLDSSYIYVNRGAGGCSIRNAGDLAQLSSITATGENWRKSVASGNTLIGVDGLRVRKFDVSNKAAPAISDSLVFGTNPTRWITSNVAFDTVQVVCYEDGPVVLDVATLSSVGTQATNYYEFYCGCYNSGKVIVGAFTQSAMGFHVWSTGNPAAITRSELVEANDYVRGVFARTDYSYIAEGHYGVAIHAIDDNGFTYQNRVKRNSCWNVWADVNNNYFYFSNADGYLYSARRSDMAVLDSLAISAYALTGYENYLYVACGGDDGLQVINIADPESIYVSDTYAISGTCYDVVLSGSSVAIANNDSIFKINISDPTNISRTAAYGRTGARYLAVVDTFLYFSIINDELFKCSFNDLARLDSVTIGTGLRDIDATTNYVYASVEENGLQIFDNNLNSLFTIPSIYETYQSFNLDGWLFIANRGDVEWWNHTGNTPTAHNYASQKKTDVVEVK